MRGAANVLRLVVLLSVAIPSPGEARAIAAPAVAVLGAEEALSPDLVARQAGLVHLVQSDLSATTSAGVVSRQRTALLLDELGLAAAGLAEPQTAQRYGRALSADYLVLIRLAGDGRAATAAVSAERVADGSQVWARTFPARGQSPAALATEIAVALVPALKLPPAPPPASAGGETRTLAVLDFHSEGEAGALDTHLADLADLLSANLTALEIPLVERGSLNAVLEEQALSASGLARAANLSKVGVLLGAQQVLETSLVVTGEQVLFDSQLIAPETGMVTGSCRVAGCVTETPALIQQLALKVAGALQSPVSDSERQSLARQRTQSLEAALHAAAGWRLWWEGRPEEAVPELEQAIYLDPTLASAWDELAYQYGTLRDYQKWAECARRFFAAAGDKADPRLRADMARHLADAEMWLGHYGEEEAAARLAMSFAPGNADFYSDYIMALARQGKAKEVRDFCESVSREYGAGSARTCEAFASGLVWLGRREVPADYTEPVIEAELDLISRTLDVFDKEVPGPEYQYRLGRVMADALVLACGAMPAESELDLRPPVRHAEECLRLAKRMAGYTDRPWISRGGWYVVGLIEYKLGHGKEAEEALNHCLEPSGPPAGFDLFRYTYAVAGPVHYLLGHVYQDLLGDPQRAIANYRQAVPFLIPWAVEAGDVRSQLAALGADPEPRTEWRHTVASAGAWLIRAGRDQLLGWLGAHGYSTQFSGASVPVRENEAGLLVLIWEGRSEDFPPPSELRGYVAGGGSLLILVANPSYGVIHGPWLGGSAESLDVTLNWLLPAFGMRLSPRAVRADQPTPLLPGERTLPVHLHGAEYTGSFFPIEAPAGQSFLRLQRPGQSQPDTVAAGLELGLGKIAVVSLRRWFAAGDVPTFLPPAWQFELMDGIMNWLSAPRAEDQSEVAHHWAAARRLRSAEDYAGAVRELDQVAIDSPTGPDARYFASCLLTDFLGDVNGAARRWREVAAATEADPWLIRRAHLLLGKEAVKARDEGAATAELRLAAGEEPDGLWGRARILMGDLKLAQGDFPGAAQVFREVTDGFGHSQERFRALFGLAYALGKQGRPEAATRVYDAIATEFGKVPLPENLEAQWPDPWRDYYPPELRVKEPTVNDAVAAAKAVLGKAHPGEER